MSLAGRVRATALAAAASALALAGPAVAEPVVAERIAVRYTAPELGGAARPRFVTARELAFELRVEGALQQLEVPASGEWPERVVRATVERHVQRDALAALNVQRGADPVDLPRLVVEARADLARRLGGEKAFAELVAREGLGASELDAYFARQVRAARYVDKVVSPILSPSEATLREAFRAGAHPFRGARYEDVRADFARHWTYDRLFAAEVELAQGARSRVEIRYL